MANKFPTNQSFQRLNNAPLDETVVFDTFAQAQDYASNNPTAYKGQVIHVKDARTSSEINDNANIYEETCYIDLLKNIVPICSFTYEAMGIFFDIIYEVLNGPTEETRNKLDNLKEIMYDNYAHDFNDKTQAPTGDYHTQPWHPANYNEYQICLKMLSDVDESYTNSNNIGLDYYQNQYKISYENANCTIEDINIKEGTHAGRYKIITFDRFPTCISFQNGNYIQEVIHMCNTSEMTDMSYMFSYCKNLKYINTKNFDTSNVTNMALMFDSCVALTLLNLSNFDTSNVTNMKGMFTNCHSLSAINLSSFDTSNVTDMSFIFSGCAALTSLDVSNFKTSNVTTMLAMFQTCHSLSAINLSNFDTSNVTDMRTMFNNCQSLTSIDLSNFDTSNVTDMSSIFQHCKSLAELNISNWDTNNVTDKRCMFYGTQCLELSNIIMNDCSSETIDLITAAYRKKNIYEY